MDPRFDEFRERAARIIRKQRGSVRVARFQVARDIETSTAPHAAIVDHRQRLERAIAEGCDRRIQRGARFERQALVRKRELRTPAEWTWTRVGSCGEIEQDHHGGKRRGCGGYGARNMVT